MSANWLRHAPGLQSLARYRRAWLLPDGIAGVALAALIIPAGMAYAELAGLPPIAGLYASLAGLVVYAVFGPSRPLVVGPDSSTAPLVAASIIALAGGSMDRRLALAGMLTIMVGLMSLAVGVFRLGFVTDLFSGPVRVGYLNGIALIIIVAQLPKLLGVEVSATSFAFEVAGVARGLSQTNLVALAIGFSSLAVILAFRQWLPSVPGLLVAVVGSTVATVAFDLTSYGIAVVGAMPQGLPRPQWPSASLADIGALLGGAVGITVLTLADTTVLSRSFASRFGYDVNANEEFEAIGFANIGAGLFQGFAVSGSSTRTAVAISAGAKSQAAGLVAAVLVGGLLVASPGLLASLPQATLAAVVIAAALSLADWRGVVRLWNWRRSECTLSIITFAGVVFLGVLPGVFVAIGLSLLNFVRRQWRPHDAVLGRAPGVKGYHDITDFTDAKQLPGLLLYRFDAQLFFANAEGFRERVRELVDEAEPTVTHMILAAEPITDIDTSAVDSVCGLLGDLRKRGVTLWLAEVKHPVLARLERYGLLAELGSENVYPTIGSAVHAYVHATNVDWVDWEDAGEAHTEQEIESARAHPADAKKGRY